MNCIDDDYADVIFFFEVFIDANLIQFQWRGILIEGIGETPRGIDKFFLFTWNVIDYASCIIDYAWEFSDLFNETNDVMSLIINMSSFIWSKLFIGASLRFYLKNLTIYLN